MNNIPQDILDIKEKKRNNLFKWNGQFSPQLIEALLDVYSRDSFTVLDPFSGSGTVLYECARKGIRSIGVDINPAANKISKVYELCNISIRYRNKLLKNFDQINYIKETTDCNILLFSMQPKNKYSKIIKDALIILVDGISDINKYHKKFSDFKSVIAELPYSKKHIKCFHGDCRNIPIKGSSIDLVITSPPYVNVFNYHQQYRKHTELLGHDILKIAKSEIGSNRKHRQNRFMTLTQYCQDITQAINEMKRVCKNGSRIILIVGKSSTIKGVKIYNGEVVKKIATSLGLELILDQNRKFKNKFGQEIIEDIIHFKNIKDKNLEIKNIDFIATSIAATELKKAYKSSINEKVATEIETAINKIGVTIGSPIHY
ncbi:class I SAM-dependent methyltransferase [Cedecea davisae]|uniref:Class I SAM-dependent methyltransferase n=1 Tax=Cedecea davisae TaxID=158484 RepID=A0ABS6DJP9_9ENTR|nr:DNA methyltransferase [Cedecea davisae]MBU4682935.1 class I SAM-dependent methyltransferase [Cedecea davisae]MBU4687966.1 class I SAM-dependent methyltransferase [Cedecea davisae]